MKLIRIKNAVITAAIGIVAMFGMASFAYGQNVREEYREYQRALRNAQRECIDYQRTGSRRDYRECQMAQRKAQQELMEYQRVSQGYNTGYYNGGYNNGGYNNSGYNNSGYNNTQRTVYDPRTGQVYRVYREGQVYNTDHRGAELLRQAVNSGYQQGYRQGQMDRQYGRGMNYYGNSMYSSGTYGYQSHVARDQYQYYFQQGFQRGYEDGYNSSTRYGYRSGSNFNILGSVLNTILRLATQ